MLNKKEIKIKMDNKNIQKKFQQKETKRSEKERFALLNLLEDVQESERKVIEESNRTQTIIFNLTDGLLLFDNKGFLKIFNPQAEIFFEIKNREVVDKEVFALKDIPKLKILLNFLEEKQERIFREELKIEENLILEISSLFISGEKGKRVGTLLILHDITREKRVEKMKTEFVSIAAHQLRTPLSAIKWTLKLLLDGDFGLLNEEQIEFIKKTYISNERMIDLINDLLNVARIEEGRYLYNKRSVDFCGLIKKTINIFKEELKKKKIKLDFQGLEKEMLLVKIDVEKIQLVIHNLLDNAIKYTPSGKKILINLKLFKKKIEFSIQDMGIGIPEDQKKRIFTKFFRGANVIRMNTEGTGLGLFVAKNIIEAHGGRIWFKSKQGEGTTFYFTLLI